MWLIPLSHFNVPYFTVFYKTDLTVFNLTDPLISFDCFQFDLSPYCLDCYFYLINHFIIVDCSLYNWSLYYLWVFSTWLIPLLPMTVFYMTDPLITCDCPLYDWSPHPLITYDCFIYDRSPYYLGLFSIWLIPSLPLTVFYMTYPLIIFDCPLYDRSPKYLWLSHIWLIPLLPLTVFYVTDPLITFDCIL